MQRKPDNLLSYVGDDVSATVFDASAAGSIFLASTSVTGLVAALGTRLRREISYTTSSVFLTWYLMLSLRRLSASFLRFRIWKPACRSLTKWLIWSGR